MHERVQTIISICSLVSFFADLQQEKTVIQKSNDPPTYHIEVDHRSLVSGALVQRAVLSNIVLPRTVEVIGHDVEVVQNTDKQS